MRRARGSSDDGHREDGKEAGGIKGSVLFCDIYLGFYFLNS